MTYLNENKDLLEIIDLTLFLGRLYESWTIENEVIEYYYNKLKKFWKFILKNREDLDWLL